MTTAAWALALLLPASPADGCLLWDALVGGGTSLQARSSGDGWGPSALATAGAGSDVTSCLRLPLRAEATLTWDSRGAPWGAGVEALEVARLSLEASVLAGLHWQVAGDDTLGLSLEALAGPSLRWVRVSSRVLADKRVTNALQPRLDLVIGPSGHWDRLRLALRARLGLPWEDAVGLLLVAGLRL